MPTIPQHNLVARPRAMSSGSSVLNHLDYEILILLLYFFHLNLHHVINVYALRNILLIWMIHDVSDDFLTVFMHRQKFIHSH